MYGLSSLRPGTRLVLLACAIAVAFPAAVPRETSAALICQNQKKHSARLRPTACKKNEQVVFDSGTEAEQDRQLGTLAGQLGTTCTGDPARNLVTVARDISGLLTLLGYVPISLCRTLDADQAACQAAYTVTMYGATACAYVASKCIECDLELNAIGICTNACQPVVVDCAADPTRTTRVFDCGQATNAAACAAAWTLTGEYRTPTRLLHGTSCFWNMTAMPAACERCDLEATSLGKCGNTCIAPADLPRCRVGGRSFGRCSVLGGNPAACGLFYEVGHYGTQTCWYDAGPAMCLGCDPVSESMGRCANGC